MSLKEVFCLVFFFFFLNKKLTKYYFSLAFQRLEWLALSKTVALFASQGWNWIHPGWFAGLYSQISPFLDRNPCSYLQQPESWSENLKELWTATCSVVKDTSSFETERKVFRLQKKNFKICVWPTPSPRIYFFKFFIFFFFPIFAWAALSLYSQTGGYSTAVVFWLCKFIFVDASFQIQPKRTCPKEL